MRIFYYTVIFLCGIVSGAHAAKYILKDGRVLEGKHALLSRVDEKTETPDAVSRPIAVIDDGLRHTYLSKSQIRQINTEQSIQPEVFKTGHSVNSDGEEFRVLASYSNSTPFDRYGRRLLEMRHTGGIDRIEQAIIELTPHHLRIAGVRRNNKPLNWDMRLATNAVPREQLTPVLMTLIDPKNIEDRIKLVRFYFSGKNYDSAETEVDTILQDWQDSPEVRQRLLPIALSVRQQKYQQIIDELELRWEAGQYHFVRNYIAALEKDPLLPDRLLEPVKRMMHRYDETDRQCQEMIAALKKLYEQLPEEEKIDAVPAMIAAIEKELNYFTLKRFSGFQLYVNDTKLSAAEKLAAGITGWYAGAGTGNHLLRVAATLPETANLIADYLRSGHDHLLRKSILDKLKQSETAHPEMIAGILAAMKPPFDGLLPDDEDEKQKETHPGFHWITIPNPLMIPDRPHHFGAEEIRYAVQLPPDYNPYLRYPMVVSLNGNQTPEAQIDWWSGSWKNGIRAGHAARHGYIVIAPDWNPPAIRKSDYDFSVFPHAAVLCSVKDAFRRFSVNTDKVFLSGHGIGGTAAWDIALSHPDMWAGAVMFNAAASKYIDVYRAASQIVPLYFVWGELEGVGTKRKWDVNAAVLNRYLQKQAKPGDITVVRYIGRGMEGFSEEILHLFDWMKVRQRNVCPFEFEAETMRSWDSFFWWAEMPHLAGDLPSRMTDPAYFPATDRKWVTIESKLYKAVNRVSVNTTPKIANVEIYLLPDMVDMKQKCSADVNGKRYTPPNGIVEPDIEVMLEDVRTRGDRLHPFWVKLTGK
ncbi:MAG: hypothetical protein LBH00_00620 [Planctomycetaceae bacterium]|jgi:pimeloyl-ACP methyl ester carboxylesterase|nr:hypothetical protein [Planctomycetaceae bacterium]